MNERIKELVGQAKFMAEETTNKKISKNAELDAFAEKFAELIVRECARTASMFSVENKRIHPDVDPSRMPDANQMIYHCTCQAVSEEINEHFFGVEQ